MSQKIWLSPPHMGGNELGFIHSAFDQNWIAPIGPNVTGFEEDLSRYLNINSTVALSSGTAALHLSLIALGVGKDDIVLCQSLTFAASANPICYLSATPVFIDSEPYSWNICPEGLETAIRYYMNRGTKPKAFICVHLYGMPARLDELHDISRKYEIPMIEDAAEALGSHYNLQCVGTFGECGILSFNGNKIITASAGGAFLSKNPILIEQIRHLASQAKDPAPHYEHSQIGYNYQMSNICAGIGRGQMQVLPERVASRRKNFEEYRQALSKLAGISFQTEDIHSFSNRWLTAITIDHKIAGISVSRIRAHLENLRIETRPIWKPLHLQPVFRYAAYFGGKVSEKIFYEGLCLPSGSNLDDATRRLIIEEILSLEPKQKRLPRSSRQPL